MKVAKYAALLGMGLLPAVAVAGDYNPVTGARLANPEPENWLQVRGNHQGWMYSPLDQINTANVKSLQPAWAFSTGVGSGHEAPPLINDETRPYSAEGVLAYSAVCTHQGCPISMWQAEAKTLYCSCHGTQYNPGDMARVVDGPAPRRLAILAVRVEDGVIVADGEFEGVVGFKKPT